MRDDDDDDAFCDVDAMIAAQDDAIASDDGGLDLNSNARDDGFHYPDDDDDDCLLYTSPSPRDRG